MKIEDFTDKNKYKLSSSAWMKYGHVVDESIDQMIDSDDWRRYNIYSKRKLYEFVTEYDKPITLDSFKPQKELNPKVWNGHTIDSRIRLRLMDIAYDFIKSLDVDWVEPEDIILTGSLANYNWSEFSDFDLHILIDFSEVDERTDFVKEYFNAKKKDWNNEHTDLTIFGYPVELYVQDANEKHVASGIYSLYKNEWIKEPEPDSIKAIKLDKFFIKEKTLKIIEKIEDILERFENEDDKKKCEIINDEANALMKKIKTMRKVGLEKSGEMNPYNIIFKLLRRLGFLEKIADLKVKTYDKINSIE